MAVLDGAIAGTPAHDQRWESTGDPRGVPLEASLTNDVVTPDVVVDSHAGAIAPGYGSADWLGRLQAVPSRHDFEVVRAPKDVTIELYNAGDAAETVDAVVAEDAGGLTLSGASFPVTIPARGSISLTLAVTLSGPREIDARYTFDAGTDALLLVVGERLVARIWRIPPDWSQPVLERWQWRTDIQRAKSGAESRRPIYPHPRRGLEFRIVTDDIPVLDRMLSGWQSRLWAVPRWMDRTVLTASASAGTMTLELDTSVGDWRADGQVVLLGTGQAESPVVAAVNATSLDLDTPLEFDWPAGTAVYPARLMRLPTSIDVARPTAGVATATVQFLADEDTETSYTADDSDTSFDGLAVYLEEPNRARATAAGYERDAERIDSGIGLVLVDDPQADPVHRHDWEYLWLERAEVDAFVAWLLAREGRASAFRYPTWSSDLVVTRSIDPDVSELVIEPVDWSRWYEGRANRDVVAVHARDGRWLFAGVTGAVTASGEETLSLDRALVGAGEDPVAVADVRRACWLERMRLDADRVELAWLTSAVATASLPLVGVES